MNQVSRVFGIVGLSLLMGLSACSKKKDVKSDEAPVPQAVGADENMNGDSDSGKAGGLQTVYFPFDSFELDEKGKATLKANVQVMKDKPSTKIQIEGHCDVRGGIQYNLALGEKRASSAKKFMIDLGVGADRISTISFGKEKLLDNGTSEDAHARNRRGNFVITSK